MRSLLGGALLPFLPALPCEKPPIPVEADPDALDTPLPPPPPPEDPLEPPLPLPPRVPSVPGPAPVNPGTVATLLDDGADPLAEAAALG